MALTFALVGQLVSSSHANAAPFEGSSQYGGSEGAEAGAERSANSYSGAVEAARRNALEAALEAIPQAVQVDSGRARALAEFRVWTGAYRILSSERGGDSSSSGGNLVRVEVEIDLRRLEKWLRRQQKSSSRLGLSWGGVSAPYCGNESELPARVQDTLLAAHILAEPSGRASTTKLSLELRCEPLGQVSHTHVHATRVWVRARLGKRAMSTIAARGYGSDPAQAQEVAIARALATLSDRLTRRESASLHLRIYDPWPSSRVRLVKSAMLEAVVGVDSVTMEELMPDGSVVLNVRGSISAKNLSFELEDLDFPDFYIVDPHVESKHELSVRFQ